MRIHQLLLLCFKVLGVKNLEVRGEQRTLRPARNDHYTVGGLGAATFFPARNPFLRGGLEI